MKTIDQAKQFKEDFMQGNGKANQKDKLTRQVAGVGRKLSHDEITNLYGDSRIVQNIIDIPAEDMTRNWFTLRMEDEQLARNIMSKLADLNAKKAFKEMFTYDRLRGDGFISLGVTQANAFDLSEELQTDKLWSVDYLHAFSSMKVNEFLINEDVFDNKYGQLEQLRINRASSHGAQTQTTESSVHVSRLLHSQTRRFEGEAQGRSLLEPLYDILTVFDTSVWSVGQILHDFTFKVYKSKDIENLSPQDKQQLSMVMDYMFRTEALAFIANDEELTKQGTSVSGIKDLLDFVWDLLSGAARMPKTVIKGQESGTITGAQYDVMNYYSRIVADQENEMKPHLEKLIRMLLMAEKELGGRIDPESLEWEIQFNPLWNVDAKTDAEIRKLVAETDQIYLLNNVIMADEIREARFGQFGLSETLKFSGDEADLKAIANSVYKGWSGKNG
ncbi:phage-related protein (TIGR01555 family) [Lysinibacillus parviboronicapiens]|uniref:Phage-related protein (TIGR01555 family) n=1 Tax=Lysinibacillus parviboronicapiens TaxID=436516 RepID=A0ABV2PN62_9BACI